MKKKTRTLALVSLAVLALLASVSLAAYFARHQMTPVTSWTTGSPSSPRHVLIATQGSTYKDDLVTALASSLELQHMYVKVIDVKELADIRDTDWHAIVILHTWEFGKPPRPVSSFVARSSDATRILAVTTSGSGREKLPGVDVVSSASEVIHIPALAGELTAKIGALPMRQ